jgi:hypothetical protein
VVDDKIVAQYAFLQLGDTLSKTYIDLLPNDQDKEIAHQLNRRTEFRVMSTDYVPKELRTGDYDAQQQILIRGLEELQQGQKKRIGADGKLERPNKKVMTTEGGGIGKLP